MQKPGTSRSVCLSLISKLIESYTLFLVHFFTFFLMSHFFAAKKTFFDNIYTTDYFEYFFLYFYTIFLGRYHKISLFWRKETFDTCGKSNRLLRHVNNFQTYGLCYAFDSFVKILCVRAFRVSLYTVYCKWEEGKWEKCVSVEN